MVLEGLHGICNITMYLESDAFTVDYDPAQVGVADIMARITRLGYKPKVGAPSLEDHAIDSSAPMPAPIQEALADLEDDPQRLLLLDFYASWCGPCRVLEATVLSTPEMMETLAYFDVIRIDTDAFPGAATYFGVKALPTLMVIDAEAHERFKHLGPISIENLKKHLNEVRLEHDSR